MSSTAEKRRSTGGKRMSQSGIESKMDGLKLNGADETNPSTTMESAAPTEKPQKQDKERKDQKAAAKAQKAQAHQQSQQGGGGKKKADEMALIGITCPKSEDLSEWYQQVILKGKMLAFTDIPGCYIYQPASYRIWEFIQDFFNARIRKMKVKNCYFPLFISEANLQREKEHIEGFAAEVAWVTHGGKNKLEKRLVCWC